MNVMDIDVVMGWQMQGLHLLISPTRASGFTLRKHDGRLPCLFALHSHHIKVFP